MKRLSLYYQSQREGESLCPAERNALNTPIADTSSCYVEPICMKLCVSWRGRLTEGFDESMIMFYHM